MAEIRWTEEAFLWLQDIHSHISNDSPNIANKVVDEIFEKVQILEDFPTWMVTLLDKKAHHIGVSRQAIIKTWLAEKLQGVRNYITTLSNTK